MRVLRKSIAISVIIAGVLSGQQFYRSQGLQLFNQGQYHSAIDSMSAWADRYSSEKGIAFYYIGESYYNLGLDEIVPTQAVSYYKSASRFFEQAMRQADLRSQHPGKILETRFKNGCCYFRMAELETNPITALDRAVREFDYIGLNDQDTLSIYGNFMAGEARFYQANWTRIQMSLETNISISTENAQSTVNYLTNAERRFQSIAAARTVSSHFQMAIGLRIQDVLYEWSKLYENMPAEIFDRIRDDKKLKTSEETALAFLRRLEYESLFDRVDSQVKKSFISIITYSLAARYLSLYQFTGDDESELTLNTILDSLTGPSFQADKQFFMAIRDHQKNINDDTFYSLSNANTSFYSKAAQRNVEALYWFGWVQFVANDRESESQFNRFLDETSGIFDDPRIAFLREDARYRIFLLQFDQNASNQMVLTSLKQEIEAFHPQNPEIKKQTEMLLQLVRVGLGEPIWGQILRAPTTKDRLDNAILLIQNMLIRASRVTGRDRVPYLNYLDKLFDITQDRRDQATYFYRGLSLFLKAEIQETARDKRRYYIEAAEQLEMSGGEYANEATYVQARSYFAAAKHESNIIQRNRATERAKPLFIKLINEARSLRSTYYLGEIFRILDNGLAAKQCYEIVMRKTKDQADGQFWYNNAEAALQSCKPVGDLDELSEIKIEDVVFPELLLVQDDELISLERFADPDFIRRQYWDESTRLLRAFGFIKKNLYPSDFHHPSSRYYRYAFKTSTANIRERIGSINTGLQLRIEFPVGVEPIADVTLDGVPLERNPNGIYQKTPLILNQRMEIRILNNQCYPFVKSHRFMKPGVERITAYMSQKIDFLQDKLGVEKGVHVQKYENRLDGNIVLNVLGLPVSTSTFLHKDFKENIKYRDFCYSTARDGYLVVHNSRENLLYYRNDPMLSKSGEFSLVIPEGRKKLVSPEGITIDSGGNVYVVDWGGHQVLIFGRDGSLIRSFGNFGINLPTDVGKPVKLMYPTRIAISEDTEGILIDGKRNYRETQIFIADRNGVHLINSQGNYWETVVTSDQSRGSLYGLAVKGYGVGARLYVVNRKTKEIERYTAQPESFR